MSEESEMPMLEKVLVDKKWFEEIVKICEPNFCTPRLPQICTPSHGIDFSRPPINVIPFEQYRFDKDMIELKDAIAGLKADIVEMRKVIELKNTR